MLMFQAWLRAERGERRRRGLSRPSETTRSHSPLRVIRLFRLSNAGRGLRHDPGSCVRVGGSVRGGGEHCGLRCLDHDHPAATMFGMRVVAIHNQVRIAEGVGPLMWDRSLAAAGRFLCAAARDRRAGAIRQAHCVPARAKICGWARRGAFSVDQMVGAWAAERAMFRRGAFPDVSRTGNWHDVGHYTQMIWPGSIRVGCAIRSSSRNDYLVCRYSPGGNVMGFPMP